MAHLHSKSYKTATVDYFLCSFVRFLEDAGHPGFDDDPWTANVVLKRLREVSEWKETVISRFCNPDEAAWQITPKWCVMFLNDIVTRDPEALVPTGALDQDFCTHGYMLRAKTGPLYPSLFTPPHTLLPPPSPMI